MGSREGAAKARAVFLARVRAGEIRVSGKVGASGVVRSIVPVQRVWVPPARLVGRVLLALFAGPLTAEEIADRCGVEVEELEDVAGLLRWHVEALRIGGELLVYWRRESWGPIWEARARLLAREEVCRVAA